MTTFRTQTGGFPIGFRRGGWKWQSDLPTAIEWALNHGFGALDLSRDKAEIEPVLRAGLRVGSVDLLEWQGLLSPDAAKRGEAVARNREHVAACGAQNFFAVMLPEDPLRSRIEQFWFHGRFAQCLVAGA